MPSVLIDTNIVVDVLVKRQSFVVQARQIWRACEDRRIAGYISAASMTDIFYLVGKEEGNAAAFAGLRLCVRVFRLCRVDLAEVQQALNIPGDDFEDNLQIACALANNLDAIVTRDNKFRSTTIPVLTPAQLLQRIRR